MSSSTVDDGNVDDDAPKCQPWSQARQKHRHQTIAVAEAERTPTLMPLPVILPEEEPVVVKEKALSLPHYHPPVTIAKQNECPSPSMDLNELDLMRSTIPTTESARRIART
jgi:hypothetical protein